jgi:predicted TIM-barrel fold metal-dependent hydrolase
VPRAGFNPGQALRDNGRREVDPMDVIDAHHHVWELGVLRYPWLLDPEGEGIFGSYDAIRRDYTLSEYRADCARQGVVRSVHVQAEADPADPVAETRWLQSLADAPGSGGFPHAIVAFADLLADDLDTVLEAHCAFPNVRGIRQILNYHPDPRLSYTARDLTDDPRFERGFARLRAHGLSFDLQCYAPQMERAAKLAQRHPETRIILDHAGMPAERDEAGLAGWRAGMRQLAACPNVAVKISGLGMCDPKWTIESLRPFVRETVEIFGTRRAMFASNFPVDKLFSSYDGLFDAFRALTADLSDDERRGLFHDNAARWYRLS